MQQINEINRSVSQVKRESVKKERNHTENRLSRRRADTTPTKGSSNDEDVVGKGTEISFLLNQSEVKKSSSLTKEKNMFSSQILIQAKLEQF